MIDNILSETICCVCSCALFLDIYCKINFYDQKWVCSMQFLL